MSFKEKIRATIIEVGKFYAKLSYVLLPMALLFMSIFIYVQVQFIDRNILSVNNLTDFLLIAVLSTFPFLPFILPAFFAIKDGTNKDYVRLFWIGTIYVPLLIWFTIGFFV